MSSFSHTNLFCLTTKIMVAKVNFLEIHLPQIMNGKCYLFSMLVECAGYSSNVKGYLDEGKGGVILAMVK